MQLVKTSIHMYCFPRGLQAKWQGLLPLWCCCVVSCWLTVVHDVLIKSCSHRTLITKRRLCRRRYMHRKKNYMQSKWQIMQVLRKFYDEYAWLVTLELRLHEKYKSLNVCGYAHWSFQDGLPIESCCFWQPLDKHPVHALCSSMVTPKESYEVYFI